MSEKCSSPCYAAAGELFGHLRESLKFGELVMFTRTWGESAPPQAIVYRWKAKVNGEWFGLEECVLFSELEHLKSVEAFAQHLSEKWLESRPLRNGNQSHS